MLVSRRNVLRIGAGGSALLTAPAVFAAKARHDPPKHTGGSEESYFGPEVEDRGFKFRSTRMEYIDPQFRRQLVKYKHKEPVGSIVIDTAAHYLYITFENNTALRYGVGVGREGFQWFGRAQVGRKAEWPRWVPPAEMRARRPDLPESMEGGPGNPLGPRSHYLYRDGRDLIYRIHGTTEPWSIGHDVSSGCIRLLNEDVIDLYRRVPVGTRVLVLKHLGQPV
ncbi:MAG TPA: L,D-transpeptidase [Beijerinckiaceae bacterium]|nr:L,D-transpeptidase [Beijerinckiaceae bacterium]